MNGCPYGDNCQEKKTIPVYLMNSEDSSIKWLCKKCPVVKKHIMINNDQEFCPCCNSSVADLTKTERMGCDFCYLFFGEKIKKIIKKVQADSEKHTGKRPTVESPLLQKFLNHVIDKEIEKDTDEKSDLKKIKFLINDYF